MMTPLRESKKDLLLGNEVREEVGKYEDIEGSNYRYDLGETCGDRDEYAEGK
jgi:hypothetical protein